MKLNAMILVGLLTATQACFALQADLDGDGKTDFADFLVLSNNFGKPGEFTFEQGDIDGDETVAFSDFLILSDEFGEEGGIVITNESELAITIGSGFIDNTEYMILAAATDGLTVDIEIDGVVGTNSVVCFEGPLAAGNSVTIKNCDGLKVVNLSATDEVIFSPERAGVTPRAIGP